MAAIGPDYPRAMGRSLVLNATYEPLCVVSDRRAAVLVLCDKADLVHPSGESPALRAADRAHPVGGAPAQSFVRVPYQRRTAISRRGVFLRDGGECQYCGNRAESIDHVVPRSRGGRHEWENVVAACRRCNTTKRDRYLHETNMCLRRPPRCRAT